MAFYDFWYYFWDQHCRCTKTSVSGNNFFSSFHCPQLFYCPTAVPAPLVGNVENKNSAQSTSDFSPKHQTSEISFKTSEAATLLISITLKQLLQTSKNSSKAVNHSFNKALLVFADLRGERSHTLIGRVDRYVDTTIGQLTKLRVPCRLTKIEHMNQEKSPEKM